MEEDVRWKQRFVYFQRALAHLKKVCVQDSYTEADVDATIHRFEVAFELAWKTLQDYMRSTGTEGVNGGTKTILSLAISQELLGEKETWLAMLEDRNLVTHTYDFEKSRAIFDRILQSYIPAMDNLKKALPHV